jgi:hypothetical protein
MAARREDEGETPAGSQVIAFWRDALIGFLIAAAILALIFSYAENFNLAEGPDAAPYAGDFVHEYAAAWIVWQGDPGRLYEPRYVHGVQHDRAIVGFDWNVTGYSTPYYPPAYYLAISPLAAVSFVTSAQLWIGLMVACLVASAILLARTEPNMRAIAWAFPALFAFVPLSSGLVSAQKGTLWLLLFSVTYVLLRSSRTLPAGMVFGLLALKPPLGLAVSFVMLFGRQWRFLAGAALTAATLTGLGLLLGTDATLGWIGAVLDPIAQDSAALLQDAHCWLGFSRLLLGDYGSAGVVVLTGLLVGVTLFGCARLVRAPLRFREAAFPLQYSAAMLATPLVSPHLFSYDLTLLLLPLGILAGELGAGNPLLTGQRRLTLYAILAVFLFSSISAQIAEWIPVQTSVLAIAALLLLLVRVLEQRDV